MTKHEEAVNELHDAAIEYSNASASVASNRYNAAVEELPIAALKYAEAMKTYNVGAKTTEDDLTKTRDNLIELRNKCPGKEFDASGAVILSHAIRWLSFKVEGKPYREPPD
jgi:hypothetical protein